MLPVGAEVAPSLEVCRSRSISSTRLASKNQPCGGARKTSRLFVMRKRDKRHRSIQPEVTSDSVPAGDSGFAGIVARHPVAVPLIGLGMLVVTMFGELLFAPGSRVLGAPDTDLYLQFVSWRDFGFRELAKGNLPLWNPHIYGGAPYFGGMQAALLYPVNWLFLVLPPALAFNWTIAIGVWLLGCFMWLWAWRRGLRPLSAFVAAALVMFSGPHFLHIHAGHVTNLPAMTWVPLIFLAVDSWLDTRQAKWALLGMVAVAMQIFAGHPQYVFYAALTVGMYTLLRLDWAGFDWQRVMVQGAGLAAVYAGGAALAAVQLLTGIQAAKETIRDAPLPWEFASMFGFPPENLVTLLAPGFFGDMQSVPYWGRCYLWEMCLYFSIGGLVLAVYGALFGRLAHKRALLITLAITLLLALGKNTPLFRLLYEFVPGFDKFRSISKFNFETIVLATLLAGAGLESLIASGVKRFTALACGIAAGLAFLASGMVAARDLGPLMRAIQATKETYLDPRAYEVPQLIAIAGSNAAFALFVASVLLGLVAGCFFVARRNAQVAALTLAALAIGDAFMSARRHRPTFDITSVVNREVQQFFKDRPGDYRILNPLNHNSAMSMRLNDVWGFDPGVVRRYAEFVTWTQGGDPNNATQYVGFNKLSRELAMLRLQYAVVPTEKGLQIAKSEHEPLPRVLLVSDYVVREDRDAIFKELGTEGFDFRKQVVLEEEPDPRPDPAGEAGAVKIVREGTDFLEIEADLPAPAILLVTDCWTPAWRAVPLPGSSQQRYEVVPANYTVRGVPLAVGTHRLRIKYSPRAFHDGYAVCMSAWFLLLLNASWISFATRAAARRASLEVN